MSIKSIDQAVKVKTQHRQPCHDCPWRRASMPGWLGGVPAEDWILEAHSEIRIACHTKVPAQCAGAATFRANICKRPRDPELLILPQDRVNVFGWNNEFLEHHNG